MEYTAKLHALRVIALTGPSGAGKGSVAQYLEKAYGYRHYSVRSILVQIAESTSVSPDRASLVLLGTQLRERRGNDYLVRSLFEAAQSETEAAVIEAIRNPAEIAFLRTHAARLLVVAVTADEAVRYDRVADRASSTDFVSFGAFVSGDLAESRSGNPAAQNVLDCMAQADEQIVNDGTLLELYKKIDVLLERRSF